jgi:hypothetical protein
MMFVCFVDTGAAPVPWLRCIPDAIGFGILSSVPFFLNYSMIYRFRNFFIQLLYCLHLGFLAIRREK